MRSSRAIAAVMKPESSQARTAIVAAASSSVPNRPMASDQALFDCAGVAVERGSLCGGFYRTEQDGVDSDAASGQVHAQISGQVDDSSLGGAVYDTDGQLLTKPCPLVAEIPRGFLADMVG
jgi:hypothetical protein